MTVPAPAVEDPRLIVAGARISALEAADRAAAEQLAALEAEAAKRDRLRQIAEAELLAAREEAEAASLAESLPLLQAEVAAQASRVHEALAILGAAVPALLTAQARLDPVVARAEELKHLKPLRKAKSRAVPRLGGLSGPVLGVLMHGVRATQGTSR